MTTAVDRDVAAAAGPRLFASWEATGRSDLAAHLAVYGPLPRHGGVAATRFLDDVARSGLTGRGGAGFPTAVKLRSRTDASRPVAASRTRPAPSPARQWGRRRGVLVVNAMEGEPASMKDAALLMCAPHLVLDGAQAAAATAGARRVVVCVPEDRDAPAASVRHAIAERRARGDDHVPTLLARPPGRFVAGEESALVGWLARGTSVPAFRPDRGAPLDLDGEPALVHNAETLAHLALLARFGADGEARPEPLLTALVTISGAVAAPGVYEVLPGAPLAEVLGLARPLTPAAALVGGFGGSWVGAAAFGAPYSAPGLVPLGASPGAGVLVVLAEDACGIAETARVLEYLAAESAGQCGPCVFGLAAVAEDAAALAVGRRDPALVPRLTRRAAAVVGRGACRHPDGAARLVESALRVFASDAAAHAGGRPCAAARAPSVLGRGLQAAGAGR